MIQTLLALRNKWNYFQIFFRLCRDIQIFKKLHCVNHCRVSLPGVHHTAESDSEVCIIPYRIKLCDVHYTMDASSAVCITSQSQTAHCSARIKIFLGLWLLLMGQSLNQEHRFMNSERDALLITIYLPWWRGQQKKKSKVSLFRDTLPLNH